MKSGAGLHLDGQVNLLQGRETSVDAEIYSEVTASKAKDGGQTAVVKVSTKCILNGLW